MSGKRKTGITLTIDYNRINDKDRPGMIDITCEGDQEWIYACVATHHGVQSNQPDDPKILEFGSKVARLVREHFGPVTPLT